MSCAEEGVAEVEEQTTQLFLINHSGCCSCGGPVDAVNFRMTVNDVEQNIEVGPQMGEFYNEVIKEGDLIKMHVTYMTNGNQVGSEEKVFDPSNPKIENSDRGYEVRVCDELQIFNF